MSPLSKHSKRSFQVDFTLAFILYVFVQIYHLFGHGQESLMMKLSFIYPLFIGIGSLILYSLNLSYPTSYCGQYRLGYNLLCSGAGTLSVAHILTGIFTIAGTSSSYLVFFYLFGVSLFLIGFISMGISLFKSQ